MKNRLLISIALLFVVGITKAQDTTDMLTKANNQFALDFYKQVQPNKTNMLISPFSASSALTMTYMGARKKTAKEMADVLHIQTEQTQIPALYNNLLSGLATRNEKTFALNVANSIWVSNDLKLLREYTDICKESFLSEAFTQDFTKPQKAADSINTWVEEKTNNKIKKLLKKNNIMPGTKLVLVNALYFKAQWHTPFMENLNEELPFYAPDAEIKATFMHKKGELEYTEDTTFQYLKIPYKGNAYLLIALPKEKSKFDSLAQHFSYSQLNSAIENTNSAHVDLFLPKFKIESEINMTLMLQQMGMKKAFTSKADFSGITGKSELQIGAVVQKTFIELDENGTEAAAATAVVMKRATSMRPNKNKTVFRADHPFLFFLIAEKSETVLFMGQMLNPTK